ncbi:MAG: phosphate acyltransferase PlsX [Streptosporangiaceae bacterium]
MTASGTGDSPLPPPPGANGEGGGAAGAFRPARADPSRPVVAVDAMGGDHAPGAIVAGAVAAYRQWGIPVVLVGRPGVVRPLLAEHGVIGEIRLVAAEDSVAMEDGALASWRRPRSSIAIACQLVHLGQATAVVSAGSTAAVVSIARLRLRNLTGVLRPAIAVALPTSPTPTVLIDAGAVADPKPEMLAQFAQLGSAYAEIAFGVRDPRVGLLSIGTEAGKGNKLIKRSHELLSGDPPHGAAPVNFAGNVEGSDLLAGKVDVIVTEGFAGNVALKTVEGTAAFTAAQFRAAIGASRMTRLGALLQRKELRALHGRFDAETYGGAALLGLEGTVVIAHGAATERGAAAACKLAADLARGRTADRIRERLGSHRPGHFLRRASAN